MSLSPTRLDIDSVVGKKVSDLEIDLEEMAGLAAYMADGPREGSDEKRSSGISESDEEIPRLTSKMSYDSDQEDKKMLSTMAEEDLADLAQKFHEKQIQTLRSKSTHSVSTDKSKDGTNRKLLVEAEATDDHANHKGHVHHKKKGAFAGVFVPTCENMWGVLIFLRFYFIVGHAGIGQALCAVFLSFGCAFCTTSSMSAIASSGGLVSEGGPYYMISRALGPCVGASVGVMYWLAITMLAVLETLGAVEGILMASPEAEFAGCKQAYGSGLMIMLVMFVWGGINFVSKLGIFFVFIVFYTLFSYYYGVCSAPVTNAAEMNPWVTGLSVDTFQDNWTSHYGPDVSFGVVLSVFFPCFTGILSGANRADVLRDPPKNIRDGTFGAIIFSLFMYSSFMVLWGMTANYRYLQGDLYSEDGKHRRLSGGAAGAHIVDEVVWNPFPHSAHIGIIVSSLSQALQCLVVAPRLLQSIAKDKILKIFNNVAPLSKSGDPVRALWATYIVAACLVLIGDLNLVAPLLSMCFLVCYAFMNISCFSLTWLNSTAFRPKGIQKKRWRIWYMCTGGGGFIIAIVIMFTIHPWWAIAALFIACSLYFYVNWTLEAKEWGSAMDGIRFQLALGSLIQMEEHQQHHVNWRPQVLILYRIHLSEELKGIHHHEILRLYSQLRKANGFCVVACVLEADQRDEHAIHKAGIEKNIIKNIMKEEQIQGFAEVVVAPSWVEGSNYIIQLTGIGGLVPNTVLLDWPSGWRKHPNKATDFVKILRTALAGEKAVLAMKGTRDLPDSPVYGTIDIWWMLHDGGFLILLSFLLVQHKVWRTCHLRVFTITAGVSESKAKASAENLTETLRRRRLFDVDVEVILADKEVLQPYMQHDMDERSKFLEGLNTHHVPQQVGATGLELDDLFRADKNGDKSVDEEEVPEAVVRKDSLQSAQSQDSPHSEGRGSVTVSNIRKMSHFSQEGIAADLDAADDSPTRVSSRMRVSSPSALLAGITGVEGDTEAKQDGGEGARDLNQIIYQRSKRAQLVVMNLPDLRDAEDPQAKEADYPLKFTRYCEDLTRGLERVLYVHSTGHEIFDISGK